MGGGPPGGRPLAFPPPQVDPAATRAQLAQALEALRLPSLAGAGRTRDAVLADWEELFACLDRELKGTEPLPPGAAEQVFDRQALVYPSDRDPLGVVLRRTEALLGGLQRLKPAANLPQLAADFAALKAAAERIEARDPATRKPYFLAVCAL
jgi:hypothetical protein